MGVIRIHREDLPRYQEQLSALERKASYPIGDDRFEIDHGPDYFRFFERLGKLYFYAQLDDGRIVGTGGGMLRHVPFRSGEAPRKCWYGGDLKVDPDHRGKHIPMSMAYKVFVPNYLRCRRGYAISMNPGDGSENRVVRLLQRFRWAPVSLGPVLELYSLDADAMRATAPLVVAERGPISYLSLRGIKDIVLASTGKPMPLLHVQFGACAQGGDAAPQNGATHMFCAPRGDGLAAGMAARGIKPSATATILYTGMSESDWRFILTSDI